LGICDAIAIQVTANLLAAQAVDEEGNEADGVIHNEIRGNGVETWWNAHMPSVYGGDIGLPISY
jgi:hypothetical protein